MGGWGDYARIRGLSPAPAELQVPGCRVAAGRWSGGRSPSSGVRAAGDGSGLTFCQDFPEGFGGLRPLRRIEEPKDSLAGLGVSEQVDVIYFPAPRPRSCGPASASWPRRLWSPTASASSCPPTSRTLQRRPDPGSAGRPPRPRRPPRGCPASLAAHPVVGRRLGRRPEARQCPRQDGLRQPKPLTVISAGRKLAAAEDSVQEPARLASRPAICRPECAGPTSSREISP
jgi:hypothetical protein